MSARLTSGVVTGLLAGLLFYLHALIPFSHAWPLLWPLLGGALAVVLAARSEDGQVSLGQGLKLATKAGVVAGLLFFAATLPTLYALAQPAFEHAARILGAVDAPVQVNTAVATGLAVAALLGTAAASLGGLLAVPMARRLVH